MILYTTVQLENHYKRGSVEITIKHGYNNDLKFTSPTAFVETKLLLGRYHLRIDGDGNLVVKKNGGTLLSINS